MNETKRFRGTLIAALLALSFLAGGTACWFLCQRPEEADVEPVAVAQPTYLDVVRQAIAHRIAGRSYRDSEPAFLAMMKRFDEAEADTAFFGTRVVPVDTIEMARQLCFSAYASQFAKDALAYMRCGSWDTLRINALHQQATKLLHMDVAQPHTALRADLNLVAQTVDDYYEALRLIEQSKACHNVNEAVKLSQRAGQLRRAPLSSEHTVNRGLLAVRSNAVATCCNHISGLVHVITDNIRSNPYSEMNTTILNSVRQQLDEVEMQFGSQPQIAQVRQELADAEDYILHLEPEQPLTGLSRWLSWW